jgi:hypothetical protein
MLGAMALISGSFLGTVATVRAAIEAQLAAQASGGALDPCALRVTPPATHFGLSDGTTLKAVIGGTQGEQLFANSFTGSIPLRTYSIDLTLRHLRRFRRRQGRSVCARALRLLGFAARAKCSALCAFHQSARPIGHVERHVLRLALWLLAAFVNLAAGLAMAAIRWPAWRVQVPADLLFDAVPLIGAINLIAARWFPRAGSPRFIGSRFSPAWPPRSPGRLHRSPRCSFARASSMAPDARPR